MKNKLYESEKSAMKYFQLQLHNPRKDFRRATKMNFHSLYLNSSEKFSLTQMREKGVFKF